MGNEETTQTREEHPKKKALPYVILDYRRILATDKQQIVDAIEKFVKENTLEDKKKFVLHFCGTHRNIRSCLENLGPEKVIALPDDNEPKHYMELLKKKDLTLGELYDIHGSRTEEGKKIYGRSSCYCWNVQISLKE